MKIVFILALLALTAFNISPTLAAIAINTDSQALDKSIPQPAEHFYIPPPDCHDVYEVACKNVRQVLKCVREYTCTTSVEDILRLHPEKPACRGCRCVKKGCKDENPGTGSVDGNPSTHPDESATDSQIGNEDVDKRDILKGRGRKQPPKHPRPFKSHGQGTRDSDHDQVFRNPDRDVHSDDESAPLTQPNSSGMPTSVTATNTQTDSFPTFAPRPSSPTKCHAVYSVVSRPLTDMIVDCNIAQITDCELLMKDRCRKNPDKPLEESDPLTMVCGSCKCIPQFAPVFPVPTSNATEAPDKPTESASCEITCEPEKMMCVGQDENLCMKNFGDCADAKALSSSVFLDFCADQCTCLRKCWVPESFQSQTISSSSVSEISQVTSAPSPSGESIIAGSHVFTVTGQNRKPITITDVNLNSLPTFTVPAETIPPGPRFYIMCDDLEKDRECHDRFFEECRREKGDFSSSDFDSLCKGCRCAEPKGYDYTTTFTTTPSTMSADSAETIAARSTTTFYLEGTKYTTVTNLNSTVTKDPAATGPPATIEAPTATGQPTIHVTGLPPAIESAATTTYTTVTAQQLPPSGMKIYTCEDKTKEAECRKRHGTQCLRGEPVCIEFLLPGCAPDEDCEGCRCVDTNALPTTTVELLSNSSTESHQVSSTVSHPPHSIQKVNADGNNTTQSQPRVPPGDEPTSTYLIPLWETTTATEPSTSVHYTSQLPFGPPPPIPVTETTSSTLELQPSRANITPLSSPFLNESTTLPPTPTSLGNPLLPPPPIFPTEPSSAADRTIIQVPPSADPDTETISAESSLSSATDRFTITFVPGNEPGHTPPMPLTEVTSRPLSMPFPPPPPALGTSTGGRGETELLGASVTVTVMNPTVAGSGSESTLSASSTEIESTVTVTHTEAQKKSTLSASSTGVDTTLSTSTIKVNVEPTASTASAASSQAEITLYPPQTTTSTIIENLSTTIATGSTSAHQSNTETTSTHHQAPNPCPSGDACIPPPQPTT